MGNHYIVVTYKDEPYLGRLRGVARDFDAKHFALHVGRKDISIQSTRYNSKRVLTPKLWGLDEITHALAEYEKLLNRLKFPTTRCIFLYAGNKGVLPADLEMTLYVLEDIPPTSIPTTPTKFEQLAALL